MFVATLCSKRINTSIKCFEKPMGLVVIQMFIEYPYLHLTKFFWVEWGLGSRREGQVPYTYNCSHNKYITIVNLFNLFLFEIVLLVGLLGISR